MTTRYAVEAGGTAGARERRAAGVWWDIAVFCTTREALEPWRFDVADATALQLGGARLGGGAVHIAATVDRPALDVDLPTIAQVLPAPAERRLYTLVNGQTRRLRLADRDAASNLVCLQLADAPTTAATAPPSPRGASRPSTGIAVEVAAFSPGRSLAIVWTSVTPGSDGRLHIATPLHRLSFGSPLVSGDRVVGVVASPTTAWPAALVGSVAARAPRPPARMADSAGGGR